MSIPIQILYHDRTIFAGELHGPLELGRQKQTEPRANLLKLVGDQSRLVIAPLDETRIGRRQLLIEPSDEDSKVRLTNLSDKVPLEISGQAPLSPKDTFTFGLPVHVAFPSRHALSIGDSSRHGEFQDLGTATLAPGQLGATLTNVLKPSSELTHGGTEELIQAMQATMDIFQSANSAEALLKSAIQGCRELVGIDRAITIDYSNDAWKPDWNLLEETGSETWSISQTVLKRVAELKQTFWENGVASASESLSDVESVIAAPILNTQGELVAVLYGDRRQSIGAKTDRGITRLEARLVELLACGVASGLARLEQEQRATVLRLQFEQYFTKKLAEELESNPGLINGRDADVSILFCDIRGFSRISEKIGTANTFTWINDVMDALSECVEAYDGVLVDYIGDELMAMWGAPKPQTNHADLACRAAQSMLSKLPEINKRWQEKVGEAVDVGIGINSGPVRAGNAGSTIKFKYSPLGNTVNLASRVQGVTKYLKTNVLITGHTAEKLGSALPIRKLCSVRVVNIAEPVHLYELGTNNTSKEFCARYEDALAKFVEKDFRVAASQLSKLQEESPNDGPSLVLLSRAVNAIVEGAEEDHPVWNLERK